MALQKQGSPFLYDEVTGDVIGLRDADGGDSFFFPLVCTWATRPTEGLTNGRMIFATDVGEGGTLLQYSTALARWRPFNGSAKLKTRTAATAAIANVETNALQALLPAGLAQVGDVLRVKGVTTKSGGTDTLNMTGRMGTAGTTGDTALNGLNALAVMAAAGLSGGFEFDIAIASATSVQRLGPHTSAATSYSGPSVAAAQTTATTVTDMSANALYLSINVASSGATNTVTVQTGASIEWVTP